MTFYAILGDIVTHINGTEIHGSRDVYKMLESDDDLNLTIVRKNQTLHITVKPEK